MGDAEGQVPSLLADALTQAPQTQPKEGSASAGQSAESQRGAARDRSIFFWHTLTHTLRATRRCTLNILHQPETSWCSQSQLIGGWSVTLATRAEEFFFTESFGKTWKNATIVVDLTGRGLDCKSKGRTVFQDAFPHTAFDSFF